MTRKKDNGERIADKYEDLGSARLYDSKTDKAVRRCHVYRRRKDGKLCMKETKFVLIEERKLKVEFVSGKAIKE